MKLDSQNQLANAVTLTSTVILPGGGNTTAWDQSTAGRHVENGAAIGLAVFTSAFNAVGTETYQFQVINDSNKNLNTSPVVIADTGTMQNTDARLVSGSFFLPIPPQLVTKQFLGAKITVANTPSWTGSAFFMTQEQYQAWVAEPANFTP